MPLLPVSDLEKWIPAFRGKAGRALAESLRGLLGIRTLSGLYDEICGSEGADFARTLLQRLNVRYRIGHPDRLAQLPEGPFVTVSNHPYGGLDGVMQIIRIDDLQGVSG